MANNLPPPMTAHEAEEQDNRLLRKSEEAIQYARQKEDELRKALAQAVATTRRMREKYDQLFMECHKRACDRRDAGLIVNRLD